MRTHFLVAAMTAVLAVQPANAQRLGKGGMGVDETAELPRCSKPLGSIALVKDKGAPKVEDQLPPGMRALMQMAERQPCWTRTARSHATCRRARTLQDPPPLPRAPPRLNQPLPSYLTQINLGGT